MAKSNRDRVSDVVDALKIGLGPYVVREYLATYGSKRFLTEMENVLNSGVFNTDLPDANTAMERVDTQGWLNLIERAWDNVFRRKLGKAERSYIVELREARNAWAHQKSISNDDAYRTADTATRLLEAISAPKAAQLCRDISQDLLRLRYEADAKKSTKPAEPDVMAVPSTTSPGLKPWRMVVQPHSDVASGRHLLSDFVANIADVKQGRANAEYAEPLEFFRRTYLTEGLVDLLVTGVKRLTGQGGDPVVQLQTSFGGGKTHSMLALYHLFSGKIGFSEIPGGEAIVQGVGNIDDRISATRAVIVGTAFSATEPRVYADCTTHTIWGDIAYQLGGVEGYRMLEKADLAGVSPGSDTFVSILEKYGPALIIIDELVAFARNLPMNNSVTVPAGSFDSVMTFFQSLTEAVKRSSDSMLLVSIPESDNEIGGEQGQQALELLAKTIGRMESVWKPVTATESFSIVRRRLFTSSVDYAARDAVLNAFRQMYSNNSSEFPSGSGDSDYFQRMQDAYPIHPELFARLYEDWSTLDRFQKTRGVLRLMAIVIHKLWQDNDQSLLIMPSSIPLWSATVRNEMLRYLPENWPAIVDSDIDGEDSKPYQLDKGIPTLGQYMASRRVARSIFIGSAPSVAGQSVRGVEEVRIRLATVQPGEQVAAFNDALRRMSNQLTYLYNDGSRYWYDTRPTVNRMAQDRAQNIHGDFVYREAIERLKAVKSKKDDFSASHVAPQSSGDIADEDRFRVVVLEPEYGHRKGNGQSKAQEIAQEILENRGNAPRLYKNMLVFIAPDGNDATAWETALREYLAWKSIDDESEQLNLDAQQRKQVAAALKRTEETVQSRLQETYSWLIVPVQPETTGAIELQAFRIQGQESFYDRATRKLRTSDLIIPRWSPDNLRSELDGLLWREQEHISIKLLWEYFARYCYLPRLFNQDVLRESIQEGLKRDDVFAYASQIAEDGVYRGLVIGKPIQVYFDGKDILVRPEIAHKLLLEAEEAQAPKTTTITPSRTTDGSKEDDTSVVSPQKPKVEKRYYGSISINPQRVNRDVGQIVEEIVERLMSQAGSELEIRLEITAFREEGFDEGTVRTVKENSRTLRFDNFDFEKE
jgi:uncharacterized protein